MRLHTELLRDTPVDWAVDSFHVHRSSEPVVAAWCGAAQYALDMPSTMISRRVYEELGPDRFWHSPGFNHFASAGSVPHIWAGVDYQQMQIDDD